MGDINETLSSLINQSEPPDKIYLNIPRRYNRFELNTNDLPKVPSNVEIVICEFDYGPATKLLPTLEKFKNENIDIIYYDDERIYPRDLIVNSKIASPKMSDDCIIVSCESISKFCTSIQFDYKLSSLIYPDKNLELKL